MTYEGVKVGNEIHSAHQPTCPYCFVPMHDTYSLPSYDDDETDEITCVACERVYEIRARLVRRFDCKPLEVRK